MPKMRRRRAIRFDATTPTTPTTPATATTALVTAVATVVAMVAVARPAAGSPAAPAPPRLQTPVLSVRRVPGLLAGLVGRLRLDDALDAAMADPSLGPARDSSCLVVQQGTVTLYARRPTLRLLPASGLKLLTATAILDRLGAQSRFLTDVRADRAATGGVVDGNLYLVGGGDPLLRTADYVATLRYPELLYTNLDMLAQAVRAAGVTRVTGSVVGDESRYDTQRYVPSWKAAYAATGEVGPQSALQVNDGFAAVAPKLLPAEQPAQTAAATFTALLEAHGVAVEGPAGRGTAPPAAVEVASLPSASLAQVAGEVLRQSDNNGAELFTKELGRLSGTPTTAAGVAAIRADLAADQLPVDQLAMVDGSGLDRTDRASCQLLVDALQRGGPDGTLGAGLAVAGQSGTLVKRMVGTPAAIRLRGKSGSLDDVSSLSGFVVPATPAPAGTPQPPALTFSVIFNGDPSQTAAEAVEDRIGVLLAGYPQASPVDRLSPLPVAG
jgi:D-alanyl-D-alanine carboxypeptidase/D-alanyl-D-alanine-endopeptidase (penicillin-binding protein 4)